MSNTVGEAIIGTAWNLQGRRDDGGLFAAAMERLLGLTLPTAPNTTNSKDGLTACWLGPGSWLLVTGKSTPSDAHAARQEAVAASGGALFDLSSSRIAYTVAGHDSAAVLAARCPLDWHPRIFPAGACAQSVFGRVNALFYRHHEPSKITIMVPRSFATDVWRAICKTAAGYGCSVVSPMPFEA